MKPAARTTDATAHGMPLVPGPGAPQVLIGYMPAWRGVLSPAAAALTAAKTASAATIKAAAAASNAAKGTPAAPAAIAAEETTKATAAATMGAMITSMAAGADVSICPMPLPIPPHGPGVVLDGSTKVLVNSLPLARMGDEILEAVGPPNKVVAGCATVLVG